MELCDRTLRAYLTERNYQLSTKGTIACLISPQTLLVLFRNVQPARKLRSRFEPVLIFSHLWLNSYLEMVGLIVSPKGAVCWWKKILPLHRPLLGFYSPGPCVNVQAFLCDVDTLIIDIKSHNLVLIQYTRCGTFQIWVVQLLESFRTE